MNGSEPLTLAVSGSISSPLFAFSRISTSKSFPSRDFQSTAAPGGRQRPGTGTDAMPFQFQLGDRRALPHSTPTRLVHRVPDAPRRRLLLKLRATSARDSHKRNRVRIRAAKEIIRQTVQIAVLLYCASTCLLLIFLEVFQRMILDILPVSAVRNSSFSNMIHTSRKSKI